MKIRKIVSAILIITALVMPSALAYAGDRQPYQQIGGDTGGTGSGSCLSAYNSCLINCDYLGGNAQAGCKIDCWLSYYECIYNSAVQ